MQKVGKVVTGQWRKVKVLKLEFVFVLAFRDNSSFDPISWVRCASGNVSFKLGVQGSNKDIK